MSDHTRADHTREAYPMSSTMTVDCSTCPVRNVHCSECMVSALAFSTIPIRGDRRGGPASRGLRVGREQGSAREVGLDAAEARAVALFVDAGLLSAGAAEQLCATLDPVHEMRPRVAG